MSRLIPNLLEINSKKFRNKKENDFIEAERNLGESRFVAELKTSSNIDQLLSKITSYNLKRSKEAGKVLRDPNRVLLFEYILELVKQCDSGDYAEVGTYRGLTASLIWSCMTERSQLHCYDTFEGFAEVDLLQETHQLNTAQEKGKFKNTSIDHVIDTVAGKPDPRLILHQGYFPESFIDSEELKFRFVHLDLDLYQPIMSGLELFWPRLVPGGALLIHDYLSPQYPGVRDAVDSFFEKLGIVPMPWCDRLGTACVIKCRK